MPPKMASHILCATIKLKTACYHNSCKNCNLQHVNDVINLSMSASKKPVMHYDQNRPTEWCNMATFKLNSHF